MNFSVEHQIFIDIMLLKYIPVVGVLHIRVSPGNKVKNE